MAPGGFIAWCHATSYLRISDLFIVEHDTSTLCCLAAGGGFKFLALSGERGARVGGDYGNVLGAEFMNHHTGCVPAF